MSESSLPNKRLQQTRILADAREKERGQFITNHATGVAKVDKVSFTRRVAALVTHT